MRQTPGAATGLQTFSGSLSALGVRFGAVTTPYREPFVGERVSLFREPDAGNLLVRFDEREQETGSSQTGLRGRGRKPGHTPTGRLSSLRLFSTLLPISNNVGGVKQFLRTLLSALIEERHFALVDGFARFQPWARFESSGSGTQSDPAISSITHCDQDSFIRTPLLTGSGMPNHYSGDGLHTIGMSGLSHVRTELLP